jgi:hypothetical protein
MDLFDKLHEQIDTVRLPLFAVTVTAAAHINTPLIVLLHWHGFRRATPLALPGVDIPSRPIPPSTITLNLQWRCFETVDLLVLDAAWQLGAWEIERIEQRSCNVIGPSAAEALACRQAFGFYEADASKGAPRDDDESGRESLMQLAARRGYLRWLFRPVQSGLWSVLNEPDDTLGADGGRRPPCPAAPISRWRDHQGRTVYRLGRVHRILLPL